MTKRKLFDFNECLDALKEYCQNNGFSYEKAMEQVKSRGIGYGVLLHHDPNNPNAKKGLADNKPMPMVLRISKGPDGTYIFEQTEHTHKYLT